MTTNLNASKKLVTPLTNYGYIVRYLVICNLHVQKKSIRANLSVRHSKLPPSMYFRLLRASYFMLLSRI